MGMAAGEERRRAIRIKENLELHYELKPEGKYGSCLTQDISEGGASIVCDTFMPRFSRMLIRLNLDPHKVIDLIGAIAWSQRIPNSYRYQTGVEFTDINQQTRSEIADYVAVHR